MSQSRNFIEFLIYFTRSIFDNNVPFCIGISSLMSVFLFLLNFWFQETRTTFPVRLYAYDDILIPLFTNIIVFLLTNYAILIIRFDSLDGYFGDIL